MEKDQLINTRRWREASIGRGVDFESENDDDQSTEYDMFFTDDELMSNEPGPWVYKVIGKLQRPSRGFVLPYHKYTGPYNPLDEQLDENDEPITTRRKKQRCGSYI